MSVQGLPVREQERYLTRRQLADLLGVSTGTVDRFVREGMPSVTFGVRLRRFRASTAVAWANSRDGR